MYSSNSSTIVPSMPTAASLKICVAAPEATDRPKLLAQVKVVHLLVADGRQIRVDGFRRQPTDRTARLGECRDQVVLAGVPAEFAGCHAGRSAATLLGAARRPRP